MGLEFHVPIEDRIRVINVRNRYELRPDEFMFKVDRSNHVFGNPYKITPTQSREQVVELFRQLLEKDLAENGPMSQGLDSYARLAKTGRYVSLGCWCAPKECHADHIRLALIKRLEKYEHN